MKNNKHYLTERQSDTTFLSISTGSEKALPDTLELIVDTLKTAQFQGKQWTCQHQNAQKGQLFYTLQFQEQLTGDKGEPVSRDITLTLLVNAFQDPRSAEISFVRLSYDEASGERSIMGNEIIKETTGSVYQVLSERQSS